MENLLYLVVALVAIVGVIAAFSPRARQSLRIWFNIGVSNSTTPVQRAKDRVKQAMDKLPGTRENVARLMTAAENAQTAVTSKKSEADALLTRYETAVTMKASQKTVDSLKVSWKTAKDAIPGLEKAAVDAHKEMEDAQQELEDFIQLIAESDAGVAQLESDATLAKIYRESAGLRQQIKDMKAGLGDNGADAKEVRDELATAKNANELSKGSEADREMAEIEKKVKVQSADDEIAAALAARNAGK